MKGTINCSSEFACLLSIFSHTNKKGRQVEQEWLCGARWRKNSVSTIYVLMQQHVKRQKEVFSRLSSDRCFLRGDHTEESGEWDTSCHTSIFIPLSRGSIFSQKTFLSSTFLLSMLVKKMKSVTNKSVLQWGDLLQDIPSVHNSELEK